MARLMLIMRGSPSDHRVVSPNLSDEEIEDQLRQVQGALGTVKTVRLPWGFTARGDSIILAQRIAADSGRRQAA